MIVSVLMLTYNHERYIEQAINSVMMQQTDFDYELVIGEDCSTDNTRKIILNIYKNCPEKIKLVITDHNVGVHQNLARTLAACQGKYIAYLDGDDYWTSPNKLQKQVNFLENHPECNICFHNVIVISEDGFTEIRKYVRPDQAEFTSIEDLIKRDYIPNCSVLFRRSLFSELPAWWYKIPLMDWPLHILNVQHGKIAYIDDIMAAYRKQSTGIYTQLEDIPEIQAEIVTQQTMNYHLNYRYDAIVKPMINERWTKLGVQLVEQGFQRGKDSVDLGYMLKIFDNWPFGLTFSNKWKKQVLARIYERLLFVNYLTKEYTKVRYCLIKLAQFDAFRFRNRGVWSIGVKAFLGSPAADSWTKFKHKICSPTHTLHP